MTAWYQESFGSDYLIVYRHRDFQGASHEVKKMTDWLHLGAGAEVLDLCCGMGRHSLALSELGYQVTGVDLSDVLLAEAKRMDTTGQVEWLRGDMREVPLVKSFEAVLNLFTSFGYFEDDTENGRVLHEVHRLLKPEGKFIIDFLNPDYVKANLVSESERSVDGSNIQEVRHIEDGFVRKRITISESGSADRSYLEQVKLYDRASFEKMLTQANLQLDQVYGGYDGQAYDPEHSTRMIFVGHRKG
ncbi:class I SAM-dependent methyltransferase [Paenibacillus eucommiae]|uniref:SAM-dependent methyltransferase n=1 Tax=Paenibacillus eucommiae TaxID=1355755 RepID=A0ABS4J0E1_9BACL|nr:class I SAM-dependent methyltransferase [Paenibacillus eucommiae]MBP1993290.1 SAM-dependent methyltransferase [Paenibacillus eucommiae]